MNAYELARALGVESSQMEYGYVVDNWELLDNAAKMLRQQADRIAELEKENTDLVFRAVYAEKTMHMIERHYDQLEAQTKPLSDEEIYALWCEADNTELLPEMRLKDGSINYIITTFAKSIEERHGIEPTDRIG